MTFAEIETALGQHLRDVVSPAIPIAWPSFDFVPSGPYVEFRHAPASVTNITLTGNYSTQRGIVLATVVERAGQFSTEANRAAQIIAGGFPMGLRLTIPGGKIVIISPPEPAPVFIDGAYIRLPVRVSYMTERL